MNNVIIRVVKMTESSGNVQYFGRAYNKDNKESLDYCCHQTKHYEAKECMSRVWFEIGYLGNFFGIPNKDIQLINLTEEEQSFIVKQRSLNRVGRERNNVL